jgi:hypothetical protein
MKSAALLISLLFASGPNDRLIGYVGQQAIHESQIMGINEHEREQSLRRLFITPTIKAYLEQYRSQWSLTEKDVEELTMAYQESQKCLPLPPGAKPPNFERTVAQHIGERTKIQRFIYAHNGGGRILFPQAGSEAFDATRNLILKLEKQGAFTIVDPELRTLTLKYWFNDQQTSLLPDPGANKAFTLDRAFPKCPRADTQPRAPE